MWFYPIVLKNTVRQHGDESYAKILNALRVGNASYISALKSITSSEWKDKGIYLCGTNKEASTFNTAQLAKLDTEEVCCYAGIEGRVADSDKPVDEVLILKVGARVMSVVNSAGENYQNGSMGYVKAIKGHYIEVVFDNGADCHIEPYKWEIVEYICTGKGKLEKYVIGTYTQYPLKLGYAITIHKSQGQTFDLVNINPYCFSEGQLYVGFSRCKTAQGMYIRGEYINPRWLKTSQKVISFYNSLDI